MAIAINSARGPCTPDTVTVRIQCRLPGLCQLLYLMLTSASIALLGYLCWTLSDCSSLPQNDVVPAFHQWHSSQTCPAWLHLRNHCRWSPLYIPLGCRILQKVWVTRSCPCLPTKANSSHCCLCITYLASMPWHHSEAPISHWMYFQEPRQWLCKCLHCCLCHPQPIAHLFQSWFPHFNRHQT